ncbi:uncharacterized protein LOC134805954 [Cydia splendana]|uniref:uncharacterized protein LOC134805954 n=1 Tax=Cydia splendana TaxID=1100963 RepID=UPI00300CC018
MNQDALTAVLTTLQQTQNEFCQQLLREVRSSTPSQADATAAAIAAAATFAAANGNFAQCTARYSGNKEEHLESFVDAVESYKSCMHITDENAVRGLSLLLTKDAGVWWQGVKSQVRTWEDALDKLRSAFGERRPPFVIYTELFSLVQGEQNTEIFVSKARALLAKLPPEDLSERVQIDMVFGLLDRRIRKRLKRENIDTFDTLLKHCQSIEDSRKENHVPVAAKKSNDRENSTAASVSPNRARSRATGTGGVAKQRVAAAEGTYASLRPREGGLSGHDSLQHASPQPPDAAKARARHGETPAVRLGESPARAHECSRERDTYAAGRGAAARTLSDAPVPGTSAGAAPSANPSPAHCGGGNGAHKVLVESGLKVLKDTLSPVTTAGGHRLRNEGYMMIPVHFENKLHILKAFVVPSVVNNLILGDDFWRAFQILPKYLSSIVTDDTKSDNTIISPKQGSFIQGYDRLDESQKQVADNVVRQFEDISFQRKGLGVTDVITHRIDTGDSGPIRQRYYRLSPEKQRILVEQVDEMLSLDVIEPCESAWSSPVLIVDKKDGKPRFCLDSRKLNSVTKRDAYNLPYIAEILDNLRDARYLSSIDLSKAFWQIKIAEEDRNKTAFYVPSRGTFHFKRTAFGLTNAPATQQRLVDMLFSEFGLKVFAYLDDIIIVSQDFNSHVSLLLRVLDKLKQANLTVNLDKCQFFRNQLKYLGYVVDGSGLHTDPAKVEAILKVPTPTCSKDLKRFLGTATWYRRFVPKFSTIAGPLNKLTSTRKGTPPFKWTSEAESAFQELKECLVSSPVLCCPDYSKPFEVHTDASNYGIGGMLTQTIDGKEHPIAYMSKSLSPAEKNYSITEREALAVVTALEYWRCYIENGQTFTHYVQTLFCNNENQALSCNNDNQTLFCVQESQVCVDKINVCQVNVKASPRPIMIINVLGASGSALVDPAAKASVAGHTLYAFLRSKGHPLVSSTMSVRLADGVSRNMTVLTAEVEVTLKHKTRKTSFVIFPDAVGNESLLGIDFLKDFDLIVDFRDDLWYFAENSKQKYELQFESVSPPALCVAALEVLREDEATLLDAQQRELLSQLLTENRDLFEPGGGPTPFAEHRIDTGDHAPIAVPPYRVTPAKEVMRAEIEKMLADDIIEECESPWGSPALLVPKANGKVRFCVDYRKLNAITKTDFYPMPLIDELVQSTKRNCYMSTLDMRSGFWQVSVRPEDRDKTAFVSPFGTYRFKRMPFGLKNSPSTFQRLIDRLRSGSSLQQVTLLAYQDDLLVISEGFNQHLADLRAVFERLRMFGLRANREKCVFAREKVKYLGHIISQDGISPDDDKVRAVLDMKAPSTLRHLRTFLQTCSWFRKFIPSFSAVAESLTRLTKKNQVWMWGPEQVEAFEQLKKRLTSAPVLIQADYQRPFILRTHSSNYALGGVLLQGQGKDERPIEYASRLLTPAERNYSTTEREALAVVWAVERFRGYIEGHPVVIGSDHQPLKWLLTLKSPSGRLVRWALKLQAFNIRFEYTPGKANVVADTLSRPACGEESKDQCGICAVVVDLPARSPTDLRRAQLDDPDLEKIIVELESTSDDTAVGAKRWSERGYFMQQGVLYRYNPDVDSEEPQLVVPISLHLDILKECHDSPLSGHQGVERTFHKISQRFFFPGMRRIIAEYIKSCVSCQRYKASNEKPSGLLQTPVLSQRNEVVAIDLFGPLPEGEKGERWIFLVEDTATRWVELYALKEATSEACARTIVEEYFLRYGFPRRIVSDNGVQFVGAVMQQCMYILGVKQSLLPLYHPEANPAERKNRDMKTQLGQLVGNDHTSWPTKLGVIRFAMNSAVCQATGATPAYLMFARQMRSPIEVSYDLRAVLDKENFVPQITPYLRSFISSLSAVRDRVEAQQDRRKEHADKSRQPGDVFDVGDNVLIKSHVLSNASKNVSAKFVPKRDGPYLVVKKVSPTTYLVADPGSPGEILGKYHSSQLVRFNSRDDVLPSPVVPKRNRGRPRNRDQSVVRVHGRGRLDELEGESIACDRDSTPTRALERDITPCERLPKRTNRGRLPARFLTD